MQLLQAIEEELKLNELANEKKIQELREELEHVGIGDFKWFRAVTGLSNVTALNSILIPFKSELEGKLVSYPKSKGNPYRFNKTLIIQWLRENFERIDFNG